MVASAQRARQESTSRLQDQLCAPFVGQGRILLQ
jgi:hypothetical protein